MSLDLSHKLMQNLISPCIISAVLAVLDICIKIMHVTFFSIPEGRYEQAFWRRREQRWDTKHLFFFSNQPAQVSFSVSDWPSVLCL